MSYTTKRVTLLFLSASLLAVLLLSSSLSNLQLHEGQPFPGGANSDFGLQQGADLAPEDSAASPALGRVFNLILLLLVLSVAIRLLMISNLKRIGQLLLVLAVLLLIANLLPHLKGSQPVYPPGESSEATQPAGDYPVSPLGEPPRSVVRLVLVAFVLAVAFLAIRVWKEWPHGPRLEDQLSREAESAVRAIGLGEDARSVILRCYLQMTQILQEEQQIERSANMTVREFEDRLEAKGFPPAPVHQLSNLFEKVRYGQQKMLREDEKTAVESLREIIQFCSTRARIHA